MSAIRARFRRSFGEFCLDVDLRLPDHGVTALFGASGSGKTTLLRCIAGLERASDAYLEVGGEVWQDSARKRFVAPHRRALGYVFQEANLFPHLSVAENLQYGLKRIPPAERRADLAHLVELFGIGGLLERRPERLSGGERQRVAIARALATAPRLLLLDEPLAALDEARKQEILPYLARLHQELQIPALYVSHSRQEVAQLADHLVLIKDGREVVSGPLQDTLTRLDAPPAHERDASSVWQVRVTGHEPEEHLTSVEFAGGALSLPYVAVPVGTLLRLQIHARDVSLALQAPVASSILNILPARISALADGCDGQTLVKLAIGDSSLLAHITRKSARLLGLQVGMPVVAQIKGSSILH